MERVYSLSNDYLFQHVFCRKRICKKFLKDIFKIELEEFEYYNETEEKNIYGVSDIIIESKNEIIIIEKQNQNVYDIKQRVMLYISKFYYEHWLTNPYLPLKPVKICIIINYEQGQKEILKQYTDFESQIKEDFGLYFDVRVWNLIEAKKSEDINKQYAELFVGLTVEKLKNSKLKEISYWIQKYNEDASQFSRMEEKEVLELSLEHIFNHGMIIGQMQGEETGKNVQLQKIICKLNEKGMTTKEILEILSISENEYNQILKDMECNYSRP